MKVVVLPIVEDKINEFYDAAMNNHPLLSEETVLAKKDRLIASLKILGVTQGFQKARLKKDWIFKGWNEYICEGFHFAYEVVTDDNNECLVIVQDAVHSLNYH